MSGAIKDTSAADGAELSRRAAQACIEMQPLIAETMTALTPQQRTDVQWLAGQTYMQGRVDALIDFRRPIGARAEPV
jgi:hypothetical protein